MDDSVQHVLVADEVSRGVVDDVGDFSWSHVVQLGEVVLNFSVECPQSVGFVDEESAETALGWHWGICSPSIVDRDLSGQGISSVSL